MTAPLRIAFQGVPGAFSELAVAHWWPAEQAVGYESFAEAIDAVVSGAADGGVIPVHNRIAGPVEAALAALAAAGPTIRVIDETEVPVELCLMALPGVPREALRVVMSHPMALAQCRPFLATLGATVVEHADTAGAAREVRDRGARDTAAIAAERAAEAYGLTVLARRIQAAADNRTRFVRIARTESA